MRLMPYSPPKDSFISLTSSTKLAVSAGLPPLSGVAGYSQSISTPWKPYFDMNDLRSLMKAARLAEDATRSLLQPSI